jgi:hypothetical protein
VGLPDLATVAAQLEVGEREWMRGVAKVATCDWRYTGDERFEHDSLGSVELGGVGDVDEEIFEVRERLQEPPTRVRSASTDRRREEGSDARPQ